MSPDNAPICSALLECRMARCSSLRWAGFDGQVDEVEVGAFDDGAGFVEAALHTEPDLTGACQALIRLHRLDDCASAWLCGRTEPES
jgi:hypothetical protein